MGEINFYALTRKQRLPMVYIPTVTGTLSVIGSSLILFMIYHGRRTGTFHRLNAGHEHLRHCRFDMGRPIVVDVSERLGCHWSARQPVHLHSAGLLLRLQHGETLIYNASLAIYFLLMIQRGPGSRRMMKVERYFHLAAFFLPFTMGVIGLALTVFNPTPIPELACWAVAYPVGCRLRDVSSCTRGRYAKEWGWAYLGCQTLFMLIVTVCTAAMYYRIKPQGNRVRRIVQRAPSGLEMLEREVALQSYWFVRCCFLSQIWLFISWILLTRDISSTGLYTFLLVAKFFTPLQGFFNFLVFMRPRYRRRRKEHHQDESVWASEKEVVLEVPLVRRRALEYVSSTRRLAQ